MKADAYVPLTSERLAELLQGGSPVFAFEPDPLRGSRQGRSIPPGSSGSPSIPWPLVVGAR